MAHTTSRSMVGARYGVYNGITAGGPVVWNRLGGNSAYVVVMALSITVVLFIMDVLTYYQCRSDLWCNYHDDTNGAVDGARNVMGARGIIGLPAKHR